MKKIGFLSFGHWSDERGSAVRSAADVLTQSIELAEAAEELGADGAYFRVHHFARQLGSPFPLLAAVGARTKRIEIGTGVIDMRYENPLYMAEDAGAADLLAGGRLQLGISRGSPEQVIEGYKYFGHVPDEDSSDADMAREHAAVFLTAVFLAAVFVEGARSDGGFDPGALRECATTSTSPFFAAVLFGARFFALAFVACARAERRSLRYLLACATFFVVFVVAQLAARVDAVVGHVERVLVVDVQKHLPTRNVVEQRARICETAATRLTWADRMHVTARASRARKLRKEMNRIDLPPHGPVNGASRASSALNETRR